MTVYSVQHSFANGYQHNAATTVYHNPVGNGRPEVDEARVEFVARVAWTMSDYFVNIRENGITASSTVRSRVAGANGNLTVTVPASTNGEFEDTTNSDSILVGNAVAFQYVIGATGTFLATNVNRELIEDTTGNVAPYAVATDQSIIERNTIRFYPISGAPFFTITAAQAQYRHQTAFTSSDLRVFVSSNGNSNPSTVTAEPNEVTGNQTVTIPAITFGAFVDTTNTDTIAANQFMRWNFTTGMGAHNDSDMIVRNVQSHADSPTRAAIAFGGTVSAAAGATETSVIEGENNMAPFVETGIDASLGLAYDADSLYVFIVTNDADASTISVLRINGADGTLTVTIPTLATGVFENTTDSDAILAADKVNMRWDATAVAAGEADIKLYGLELTETPVVAVPPIRPMDQLHPRAAPRAAPYSYSFDNLLAVPERVFPPIRPMDQLHPRAAPRAAPNSYWIDNLLAVPELEFPPIRPMAQLHPRAAPRASPLSYWIDNLLAVEEFPPVRPMDQLLPRAARRAAPYSYWVDNLLSVEELVFPPIRPMDQLHPRAAPRAAPYSYWFDNLLVVAEVLPPPIRPMDQLHPRAAPRAAPYSYWIDNLLAVPEIAAVTIELTYLMDVIIGSPAIGFQEKELILKRILLKVLHLKDLIGPD